MSATAEVAVENAMANSAWASSSRSTSSSSTKVACELVAGANGGMLGIFAGQPFDMIKVRMQAAGQSSGFISTSTGIIRNEGFRSLYKGMFAPLVGMSCCSSVCFAGYGFAERILQNRQQVHREQRGNQDVSLARGFLDVFLAGAFSCALAVPFTSSADLAKSQLIMQKHRVGSEKAKYSGPSDVFKDRWRQLGLRGCTQGLAISYLRDCKGYGWYFVVFEGVKYSLGARSSVLLPGGSEVSGLADLPKVLLAGGCAGTVAYLFTTPIDVLRSRIQILPVETQAHENTIRCVLRKGISEHGYRFLIAGWRATIPRAFVLNMACCCGYEYTLTLFKKAGIY